jgi:hypothetical protein
MQCLEWDFVQQLLTGTLLLLRTSTLRHSQLLILALQSQDSTNSYAAAVLHDLGDHLLPWHYLKTRSTCSRRYGFKLMPIFVQILTRTHPIK